MISFLFTLKHLIWCFNPPQVFQHFFFRSDLLFGFLSVGRVCNAICGIESVDASDLPGPSVSNSCSIAPSVTDVYFKTL